MNRTATACLGCGKAYDLSENRAADNHGWWHFERYTGPDRQGLNGYTLTGSACPACSDKIYNEPGGYERAVAAQEARKALT